MHIPVLLLEAIASIILLGILCQAQSTYTDKVPNVLENSPLSEARGVFGGRVLLPCDVTPPKSKDSPILVLFYRENKNTPIYTLDSRDSNLYSAYHWADPEYKARVSFQVDYGNQGLLLKKVRKEDQGFFRCRVDFKSSPTRNSRVHLSIIEPPHHLVVTSKWRDETERVISKVVGPYPVDAKITISCQVTGGLPPPQVTWWHEGSLLDDLVDVRTREITKNSLQLPPLTRSDLMKKLTCHAVNSNLTSPLSTTVYIDLAFPPKKVRIRLDEEDASKEEILPYFITVKEGEKNPLRCDVEGSRPSAVISWSLDGQSASNKYEVIPASPQNEISHGNLFHSSTLIVTPTHTHDGSVVVCQASNPQLPEETLYDSVKLNVLYKPRLRLNEGTKINIKDIVEGQDVYFECQVNANPNVDKIQWTHNGIPLFHNKSTGVLLNSSGTSLILQDVSKDSSGNYTCSSTNSMGSGVSNTIELKVKYVPKCYPSADLTYGGGLKDTVTASCKTYAQPPATEFVWAQKTPAGDIVVPSSRVHLNGSESYIKHQIISAKNFGTFLCWASNTMGNMTSPCIIKIIPAAIPDPVSNCKISSNGTMSDSSGYVSCIPGWNGGLEQHFALEVRKATHTESAVVSDLQHSSVPDFYVRGLQEGEKYVFSVTSSNEKGSSIPVSLTYTVPGHVIAGLTHARTHSNKSLESYLPLVAVLVGVILTLLVSVTIVVCVVRTKLHRKKQTEKESYGCQSTDNGEHDSYIQTSINTSLNKESELSPTTNLIPRYNNCDGVVLGVRNEKCCVAYPIHHERNENANEEHHGTEYGCLLATNQEMMPCTSIQSPYTMNTPRYGCPPLSMDSPFNLSDSLGRASTLSSSSSTSRPTFRSSQTTVVFNPKFNDTFDDIPPPPPLCTLSHPIVPYSERIENVYSPCPVSKESSV